MSKQAVSGSETEIVTETITGTRLKMSKQFLQESDRPYLSSVRKPGIVIALMLTVPAIHAQMVNPGFELTTPGSYTSASAITGWTIESRTANSSCTYTNWTPGSPEVTVRGTPFNNYPFPGSPLGIINPSPLGGNNVIQIGDTSTNQKMTRLRQTFPVTFSNTLLQIAYSGFWQDGGGGHGCCDQPGLYMKIYNCQGNLAMCTLNHSLAAGIGCQSSGITFSLTSAGHLWNNWLVRTVDLTPYINSCVTLELTATDCSYGEHFGTTLLDISNGSPTFSLCTLFVFDPPGLCPNTNLTSFQAPVGYALYQWEGPNGLIPPPLGQQQYLTVTNASLNSVYTVTFTSSMGCQFVQSHTVTATQASIAGYGVTGSCPLAANGSATVIAGGIAAGHTYTWTASNNSIVSTASVATGLSPGQYTVTVGSSSLPSCGYASTVVTIPVASPTLSHVAVPYCSAAYLKAPTPGANYKWYVNGQPVGGTVSVTSFTITNPCNGCQYVLAYDNPNGCRDSIAYHTLKTSGGAVHTPSLMLKPSCPGLNNGSALAQILTANGLTNPTYYMSVSGTGTNAFTFTSGPTATSTVNLTSLGAGMYSITAFDGSCFYTNNFTIGNISFDYSIAPKSSTLCSGNTITIVPSPLPGSQAFHYTWSPTTWLNTNVTPSTPGRTISPGTLPQGSITTVIYSITVTPTINFCPVTKTISVTAANPAIPSIHSLPALCDNSNTYSIQVVPAGGTFSSGIPNFFSPVGVLQPQSGQIGTNTFTYAVHVGSCSASQSASVVISKFHSAQLSKDSVFLCDGDPPLSLQAFAQQTVNGSWTGPLVQNGQFATPTGSLGSFTAMFQTWSTPDSLACPDLDSVTLVVTPLPPVAVASSTACNGLPFVLLASGAPSFSYSSGAATIVPQTNTTYSVWGVSLYGCLSPSCAVAQITVAPSPSVQVQTSHTLICSGETVTLTASGAQSYTWTTGPAHHTWVVSPAFTTLYVVKGSDGACSSESYVVQNVSECAGLADAQNSLLRVYPNPFSEQITVESAGSAPAELELTDLSGRIILNNVLDSSCKTFVTSSLTQGVYLLTIRRQGTGKEARIVIKQ